MFGENGDESKQLDIIILNDTVPLYKFSSKKEGNKSFGPVEGCIGVASIKSKLDKIQLFDALHGIASIPPTQPLGNRVNPMGTLTGYDDWPYKIIYASSGLNPETILGHMKEFYQLNPNIPMTRKPNIIHVAGSYVIFRMKPGHIKMKVAGSIEPAEIGTFHIFDYQPDVQGLMWVIDELQRNVIASSQINYSYSSILENTIKS